MKPILLSPVANFSMLSAAIEAGCDAVYFGIQGLNMREGAKNFSIEDLPQISEICKIHNITPYLALNTIIYDEELEDVKSLLIQAKENHIPNIICWDMAVIKMAKELGLNINLSTQASVSNIESLRFYHQLGVNQFTLARELTLEQLRKIREDTINTNIKLECFIHGAMCVSYSGRCFLSQFLFNKSANRGKCIQPCRRSYKVIDPEEGHELELHNNYVMSPKDLCTLPFIEKILETDIDILKIEGRGRSAEYVKIVTACYREAIDAYYNNQLTEEMKAELVEKLKYVYHRDFSSGFFMGKPVDEWCDTYGSKATKLKQYVGKVVNYFPRQGVAEIYLRTGSIKLGDEIIVIGKTTGVVQHTVDSMQIENTSVKEVVKGQNVGIKLPLVRKNDEVYLWKDRDH